VAVFVSLAILCVTFVPSITAQVFYGTLVGAITDSSGAGAPNVNVTIVNQQTNQTRKTTTNSGGYSFSNVLPGVYRLRPGWVFKRTQMGQRHDQHRDTR
jgi:hypothetical protein